MEESLNTLKKPVGMAFDTWNWESDFDEEFFILNFGTRLLTAVTDKDILIDIALETLADFSRGTRIALMSLDDKKEKLVVEGIFRETEASRLDLSITLAGTVAEKIVKKKAVTVCPLAFEQGVPLPAEKDAAPAELCLCLPLVGGSFQVVGLVTIALSQDHSLTFFEAQQLRILSTVLAVSLENAKLFARLIHDSLTDLYTRRFYEIRVEEELAKLRRNRGFLSVILFDLDHFKKINDSYGHLMGDDVLRQFGILVQAHVRKGSTIVSRYGGEEFILLMPDAQRDDAFALANRIRSLCLEHAFGDADHPIQMTVSGGVASTDYTESTSAKDLFQRADTALYQAKRQGRNQIVALSR